MKKKIEKIAAGFFTLTLIAFSGLLIACSDGFKLNTYNVVWNTQSKNSRESISGTLHQDLWNAEIRGKIITDLGKISFRALTPYDKMVNLIEVTSTEIRMAKKLFTIGSFYPDIRPPLVFRFFRIMLKVRHILRIHLLRFQRIST